MASNSNVVFTLTAISIPARDAFCDNSHNRKYYNYHSPPSNTRADLGNELSQATNVGDDADENHCGQSTHQLLFTFDRRPKDIEQGWVFGSDPKKCDVLLGTSREGISGVHCRISYNRTNDLVLIDQSTHGTAVSYGHSNQGRAEKRSSPRCQRESRDASNNFTWILFPWMENKRVIIGHTIASLPNAPVVEFSVEIVTHEIPSRQFQALRDEFLYDMRSSIPLSITGDAHATSNSLRTHVPRRSIFVDGEMIGSGEHTVVYRTVNVSSGKTFAAKVLLCKIKSLAKVSAILGQSSHDHIVEFTYHDTQRELPRLIMEYLPLGNLADQDRTSRLTEWEAVTVLCQGLDALRYLHLLGIVHHNLNPNNILVHLREPGDLRIKVADVGLCTDHLLSTPCCGTDSYRAPELRDKSPYDETVDIWSLGVIVFQFAFELPPRMQDTDHASWCFMLSTAAENVRTVLGTLLSLCMLRISPDSRLSADECMEGATSYQDALIPTEDLQHVLRVSTEAYSSSVILGEIQRRIDQHVEGNADVSFQSWLSATVRTPLSLHQSGTDNLTRRPTLARTIGNPVLQNDKLGYYQMMCKPKTVSMRIIDHWLNATDLMLLAGITPSARIPIRKWLKQYGSVKRENNSLWVPFTSGLFLCQYLELEETLRPLLSQGQTSARAPSRRQNPFLQDAYIKAYDGKRLICLRKCDLWVNVTQLVRSRLICLLMDRLDETLQEGEWSYGYGPETEGKYVRPFRALNLCKDFGQALVEHNLRKILMDHGYKDPALHEGDDEMKRG
ncbi:kinase-like protein [Plenodomus tracheiphilus IPT5]|uniref:non-specific serine/threonine protein kinase n=1 Tax=Plenodomus tracheiphilus IPT5 TaxID=1408161 RepID=A0A6A7ALZ3_9PLEO|nr:kinase-like protein [Plenodomus tracheiphilus IPT5]